MAYNQIVRIKKLKTDADVFEALRKNAVKGIQVFFGASPEWWAEGDDSRGRAYMNSAREWADEKFGKNNIVSFDIHYDEPGSAPHCTVIYAPIVDGKLNAKKLIGGVRWELQRMQDDFHEKVAKPFRLGRGERREPDDPIVRHTELKHFKKWMADEREKIEKEKAALEEEKNALADEKAKTEAERKAMSYNWLGDVFYNLADEEVLEVRNAAQAKADGFRESKVKKPGQITQQRGIPEKRPEVKHRNHA